MRDDDIFGERRDPDDLFAPARSDRDFRPPIRDDDDPFSPRKGDPLGETKKAGGSAVKWIALGVGVFTILGIVGFLVMQGIEQQRQALGPREEESADERFARAAAAFDGEPADVDSPRVAPLEAMIEDYRLALQSRDAGLIGDMFDTERMLREAQRSSNTQIPFGQFEQNARNMKFALSAGLAQNEFVAFERFEISHVEFDSEANQSLAMLYVRQWHPGNVVNKFRYWAIQSGDRWRIYDLEDLNMSLRTSDLLALSSTVPSHVSEWQLNADIQRIQSAMSAIVAGNADLAEEQLRHVHVQAFPPQIQAWTHMIRSNIAVWRGDNDLALREVELAESLHPDMVMLLLQRAIIFNAQGRYEEALAAGQEFLEKLGADADATLEVVVALQGLGRHDEALTTVREGLDGDPSSIALLVKLAEVVPPEEAAELGERYMQLPDPAGSITFFGDSAYYYPESLWAVMSAYRETHPHDVAAIYYGADSLLQLSRNDEAFELLEPYVADGGASLVIDPVASYYNAESVEYLFYRAAVASGRWEEAYELAEDKSLAFDSLASWMEYSSDEGLRDLVAAHASAVPDDSVCYPGIRPRLRVGTAIGTRPSRFSSPNSRRPT